MTRVFAAGTFDGLHPGHIAYLSYAKSQGDELWVVVARDKTLAKTGKKPYFNEKERRVLISALKIVDTAMLGDEKDVLAPVKRAKPDKIVLGHDQKVNVRELARKLGAAGLYPKITRCKPFKRGKYKSGKLKERKPNFHVEV